MNICFILWTFGLFYEHLVHYWTFGILCGRFGTLYQENNWQPWSTTLGRKTVRKSDIVHDCSSGRRCRRTLHFSNADFVCYNFGRMSVDEMSTKMLTKCRQNVDEMSTKCWWNVEEMSTKMSTKCWQKCRRKVDKNVKEMSTKM
jgi:hypothetical protein